MLTLMNGLGSSSALTRVLNITLPPSNNDVAPYIPPVQLNSAYQAKIIDAFGLDQQIEGFTGTVVRLRKLDDNSEADFGLDSDGRFDIAAVNAWRSNADVDVVKLYSQKGTGEEFTPDGTAIFIRDNTLSKARFGFDYDFARGDNGARGNNLRNNTGGFGITLDGSAALKTGASTYDVSSGFEMHMVASPLQTKTRGHDNLQALGITATTTNGSNIITVSDSSNIDVNMWIIGGLGSIQEFTQVVSIDSTTQITVNQTCRASNTHTVDFREDLAQGNSDSEWWLSYGHSSSQYYGVELCSSNAYAATIRCRPDGSGEVFNKSNTPFMKENSVQVLRLGMSTSDYYGSLIQVAEEFREDLNPPKDIIGGVFNNGQIVIGGRMSSSSNIETISSTERAKMLFGSIIITAPLTNEENFELNHWLHLYARNDQTMTDAQNDIAYEEHLIFKDAVQNGDGTGTLLGRKNKTALNIDSANFIYNTQQAGLRGLRTPLKDDNALWRATNDFGGTDNSAAWMIASYNEVSGGSISAVMMLSHLHATNDAVTNLIRQSTVTAGVGHTDPHWITRMPGDMDIDSLHASRSFEDGQTIGTQSSPDSIVQYNHRIENLNHKFNNVIDYGGTKGNIRWNKDTLANQEPNQTHLLKDPVMNTVVPENVRFGKQINGYMLQLGSYQAPAEFNTNNSYEQNKPFLLKGDAASYVSKGGAAFGNDYGSIAYKDGWASVVWGMPDTRLCNSAYSRDFVGTLGAISKLADGRGQDYSDRVKLGLNYFRILIS